MKQATLQQWVKSTIFNRVITGVIIFACILIGLETSSRFMAQYGSLVYWLNGIILAIFTLEIILRLAADQGEFFKSGWNWFDLIVVLAGYLPAVGDFILVLRLFRAIRILRLAESIPRLRVVIEAMFKSIPSIGYVVLLMFLHLYAYGVIGFFLFHQNDPLHFTNLPVSIITLFRVVTLEGWTNIFYLNFYGCAGYYETVGEAWCTQSQAQPLTAVLYFGSFIVTGSFIIINLFVGVVLNFVSEMEEAENSDKKTTMGELAGIKAQLTEIQSELHQLNRQR